jgi:hypothetical protein
MLQGVYSRLLDASDSGYVSWFLWGMGWTVAAYTGMLVYTARHRLKGTMLFICFLLANLLFMMAITPATDYRYTYFMYLAVFVTPLLMLAELRGNAHRVAHSA